MFRSDSLSCFQFNDNAILDNNVCNIFPSPSDNHKRRRFVFAALP